MIKYKYICIRFIVDKNVKIYKKDSSNKLYCKNKINTKIGKKICMISLNNYIKKRKKLMLSKHNKKQVLKKSSKKKTNPIHNNSKKKTKTTLQRGKRVKKYNKIKGGTVPENLNFKEVITERDISAFMVDKYNDDELGYFTLNTTRPYDLSVSIVDNYQGKKLSNELLKTFYYIVKERYVRHDESGNQLYDFNKTANKTILKSSDILVIDTDVSGNARGVSFWGHIGMTPNRQYDRQHPNNESRGYEKTISLKDLLTMIEINYI